MRDRAPIPRASLASIEAPRYSLKVLMPSNWREIQLLFGSVKSYARSEVEERIQQSSTPPSNSIEVLVVEPFRPPDEFIESLYVIPYECVLRNMLRNTTRLSLDLEDASPGYTDNKWFNCNTLYRTFFRSACVA